MEKHNMFKNILLSTSHTLQPVFDNDGSSAHQAYSQMT